MEALQFAMKAWRRSPARHGAQSAAGANFKPFLLIKVTRTPYGFIYEVLALSNKFKKRERPDVATLSPQKPPNSLQTPSELARDPQSSPESSGRSLQNHSEVKYS